MMEQPSPQNPTAALRRLHRWRMALFGLIILAAGITLGVAATLLLVRPTDRRPPIDLNAAVAGMVMRFQDELNLSPEQVESIRTILHTRMENLEKLRTEARPKIEEQLTAMKLEIDQVLTDDQRQGWQRLTERLDREFHRGMRPGRGGRPGPGGEGPRGGGRGDWPGRPGPDSGYRGRGFDPNGAPPPWDAMSGRGDPNSPARWRPSRFDRPGPNDGAWQDRPRFDPNGPRFRGIRQDRQANPSVDANQ
jgi:hypothetical protein